MTTQLPERRNNPAKPAASLVVPTFERRETVVNLLRHLERQTTTQPFEVVVSVDGSSDGTLGALAEVDASFPVRVLFHPNHGLSFTRNRGARRARAPVIIFLDDDMTPDAALIEEHLASHLRGADVVLGAMPLDPTSPDNLLARGVGVWGDDLAARLLENPPTWRDVFGGHLSVKKAVFDALGGFDERFTRRGTYGHEDLDFGYRLHERGHRVVFNPKAKASQLFLNSAATVLCQSFESGRADVHLARKHPALVPEIFDQDDSELSRTARWLVDLAPPVAALVVRLAGPATASLIDRTKSGGLRARWFHFLRAIRRWQGVRHAGGRPRQNPFRILCYHAVEDLGECPVLAEYGIPAAQLDRHLTLLEESGHQILDPDEALEALLGRRGLPERGVLLTFDDCYRSLSEHGAAVLAEHAVRALAFVVTGEVGGSNTWDERHNAKKLTLMDEEQLRAWTGAGHALGAHSRSHPLLPGLGGQLSSEVDGALDDLEALDLGARRVFAYPHGGYDQRVLERCRKAKVELAFSVEPGRARPGKQLLRVPRTEIMRSASDFQFLNSVRGRGEGWSLAKVHLKRFLRRGV